jgi:hypothetical protein
MTEYLGECCPQPMGGIRLSARGQNENGEGKYGGVRLGTWTSASLEYGIIDEGGGYFLCYIQGDFGGCADI